MTALVLFAGGFATAREAAQHLHNDEVRQGRKDPETELEVCPSDVELSKDTRFTGFPFHASALNAAASSGNVAPPWAKWQGITFSGPVIVTGMELTEVVDEVGPYFIHNCCRKPKMQQFVSSNEAAVSVT